MPFALIFIGLVVVIAGFQNTYKELGTQLAEDFTGEKSFGIYILSILGIGAIGYFASTADSGLRTFSRAFMFLVILAMVINNHEKGNFFRNLASEIGEGMTQQVGYIGAPLKAASGDGKGGSDIDAGDVAKVVGSFL